MFRHHPVLTVFTFGYLGLVAFVTLGPQPFDDGNSGVIWSLLRFFADHRQTAWIDYERLEFGMNVLMFVPVGLFLLLLLGRRRWWAAVLLGVALTVGIETAQLFLPDRVSDLRDIVANSVGAFVGVMAALLVTWPAAVRRARAERMGLGHRDRAVVYSG